MNINDYKYKIELHAHTNPGSGCANVSPERTVELYKQKGCDAIVITNHFHIRHVGRYCEPDYFYECAANKDSMTDIYLEGYRRAYEAGRKENINVLLGMEICFFAENGNDYLIFGIDEDFVKESINYMDKTLGDFYKAMKRPDNVIVQAHPFRNGMIRMPKEYLDGVETFNLHPENNSRVGVACEYARNNGFEITTCGSDFHNEEDCAMALLKTKTLPTNSFELADIINSHDYLFEISGSVVIPQGFGKCGR